MKLKELIKNKIYYVECTGSKYLVKKGKDRYISYYSQFIANDFSYYEDGYREATTEECAWFNYCDKNGYIPREEFLKTYTFTYEIY